MLQGLTSRSISQLQLGAGVFLQDFDFRAAASAEELRALIAAAIEEGSGVWGLTTGPGMFRCRPLLHALGEDAGRIPTREDLSIDGWTATLSGTLAACSEQSLPLLLPGLIRHSEGRVITLRAPAELLRPACIPSLCWVGDTSCGLALIELTDALNVSGAAFTFLDGKEGSTPFEFRAHQAPGSGEAPFRIFFFS